MIYHSSKEFRFLKNSKKCCVGFIDLVNSTIDTLPIISQVKIENYYSIFINTLTKIIRGYDGEIVKNIGDSLLFYFPNTSKTGNGNDFKKVIECFLEILDTRSTINSHLIKENLPTFNYRITVDYGILNFALTGSNNQIDIFGSIVNICSKLNSLSIPNKITIGESLYKLFMDYFPILSDRYDFSLSGEYRITEHNRYLLYNITRTKNNYINKHTRSQSSSNNAIFVAKSNNDNSQLKDKEGKKEEEKVLLTENKRNNRKKIIIIDDDKNTVLTFKYMLENNNNNNNKYDITPFTNPIIALKYLKQNFYSFNNDLLIILDVRMKNLNGIEFYKQIKSLESSIKILFITGLDIIDEIKSMIPGLTDNQIKKKPIEGKVLIKTVNKLLN